MIAWVVQSLPLALAIAGVLNVTSLTLGFTASPAGTADLPVSQREIARFDSGRITFA